MDKDFNDDSGFTLPQKILLFLEESGRVLYETLYHPARMAYHYDETRDKIGRQAFYNAIRRMKKAKLIAEQNGHFEITEKGKLKILWLKRPMKEWDGKWRIVVFDIPEKKRDLRNFFRSRLKELGFRFLQESVWISPYNVADKVEDLINQSRAGRYVHYLVVEEIDNKNVLMKLFHLKRKSNKSRSVESFLLDPQTDRTSRVSKSPKSFPKITWYDSNMKPGSNKEIPSQYDPKQTEDQIYELWEKSGAFTPTIAPITPDAPKPFSIVIPPPNVTGSLHMGHALNNTIQDILIRRSRMKGVPTLWVPGTDHAGIATQNVVEKALAKEGKSRQDLGREEFVKHVWQWVDQYGHIIIDQLKKMGCSCDWSRQRFTMDEDYSEAVKAAFKHYFDKGLIYQGERVINWCVRCQTALSDIEVEYRDEETKLYYIKYGPITLATTRPETKFGDTAIAVHPDDKRYQKYVGKELEIESVIGPIKIKVIADESADPKFGTGAVKVTPAHDPTDFEIGQRHHLPIKIAIDKFGKMTKIAGKFAGLKVAEAREKVAEEMQKLGILEKAEPYQTSLPYCYRCGKMIEPLLSKQWFLKMSELIKPAIKAIKTGEIKIAPPRWGKVYLDWMRNIKDWCISRQIYWGHKIPIKGTEDVLDTWFSSALWPFATLGWPKETEDLKYFYPTTVLSTARDINMLWVVRMIFSGLEFMKAKPFEQVYIHPTIFNIEGKRMSKSLGTGIDPLDLIEKYGADAVRFGLTYINTGTQDIKFDENAILAGKKFANKIWNISRFVMLQIGNSKFEALNPKQIPNSKSEIDKQILKRLDEIVKSTNDNLDNFRFGQAAHELYDFIWHNLADQYLEQAKTQMENVEYRINTTKILLYVLATSLKLLHPMMPFVTEEIWQVLARQQLVEEKLLINASWPEIRK